MADTNFTTPKNSAPVSRRADFQSFSLLNCKEEEVRPKRYLIALSDPSGKLIEGSEFPDFFERIGEAFDMLPRFKISHANASVFWRPM